MIPLLRRFLLDETAFVRWSRAALFGLGEAMREGLIPTGVSGGGKYGVVLMLAAFMLGAGDKNPRMARL